jgi:AcrR family transcriptional regulator
MIKKERRKQLMEVAREMIRTEGTAALTLARLAERAGVTKPIAYQHFGTRAGLLIALFQDYDEHWIRSIREALIANGKTIHDVATILGAAYIDCVLSISPEAESIAEAIVAYEENKNFIQCAYETYMGEFRKAFAPFVKLPGKRGVAVLVAQLGAASSLAQAAATGKLTRNQAVTALSAFMVSSLQGNGQS